MACEINGAAFLQTANEVKNARVNSMALEAMQKEDGYAVSQMEDRAYAGGYAQEQVQTAEKILQRGQELDEIELTFDGADEYGR